MQNNKIFSIGILTFVALIGSNNCTMAQETDVQKPRPTFGLEYTGEVQTDFKRLKSVNLLELGAELPLTSKLSVELGSISVLTTDEAILTNCLQNFSSIDAPNIPFALTTAGLAWQINERHHLFAGIHRIDDNYFCSDMLGLFTHSSCGAFPTITANYDIAAYPVSALGIHYGYTKDAFSLETSLYNGVGYKDFSKRDNVFRICPESDGVFLMAQGEYDKKATRAYVGGSVLYSDLHATAQKQMRPVVWLMPSRILQNVSPCLPDIRTPSATTSLATISISSAAGMRTRRLSSACSLPTRVSTKRTNGRLSSPATFSSTRYSRCNRRCILPTPTARTNALDW